MNNDAMKILVSRLEGNPLPASPEMAAACQRVIDLYAELAVALSPFTGRGLKAELS